MQSYIIQTENSEDMAEIREIVTDRLIEAEEEGDIDFDFSTRVTDQIAIVFFPDRIGLALDGLYLLLGLSVEAFDDSLAGTHQKNKLRLLLNTIEGFEVHVKEFFFRTPNLVALVDKANELINS